MYCIKCGVELEDGIEKCPLCGTKVPVIEVQGNEQIGTKEYPTIKINLYEIKIKKIKKSIFLTFLTICMITIFEIYLQNVVMHGEMRWGYYAIPSVILFLLSIFVFLDDYSFRQNLLLLFLGISAYLAFLDFHDGKFTWSLRTGIPIVLTLYVLGLIFSWIMSKHKSDKIKTLNYFLILVGVFLLILELIVRHRLSWSLWASIPLFILGIMLKYIYKSYKEEFTKRLHL
ncbi:MAG: zinc ribbon domain-containing protein [Leptotrichiaceae bacterium]|nr:zinc ribbon domain-containing protein [Leptotrichiaceae bacterium]